MLNTPGAPPDQFGFAFLYDSGQRPDWSVTLILNLLVPGTGDIVPVLYPLNVIPVPPGKWMVLPESPAKLLLPGMEK